MLKLGLEVVLKGIMKSYKCINIFIQLQKIKTQREITQKWGNNI